MKKLVDTTIGGLAGVGFLVAALVIFAWDIGKLHQVRESRDWPQVEGIVTRSTIDDSHSERLPDVVYVYTVAGIPYRSGQIGFDIFDKPGGQGRLETIVARYRVGQSVTVYYDPKNPATAILEPGDSSPFVMALLYAALFLFSGLFVLWRVFRRFREGEPVPRGLTVDRRILVTVLVSVLLYLVLVLVSLESSPRETFVRAFGECPVGIPNLAFVLALQTLLYLPLPWVFWHGTVLIFHALENGRRIGIGSLLTMEVDEPDFRRSRMVCIGGLVYGVLVLGIWVVYAAVCGI